jgi:hypothetical protein
VRVGDHVYVINGEHGRVKIGSSINPEQRCAELQTGSPVRLWVEHVTATLGPALPVEIEAHAMLDRYRLSGEWFAVSVEVAVATIAAAAHHLGVPISTGGRNFTVPDGAPYNWTKWLAGTAMGSMPFWGLSAAGRPFSALAYLIAALAIFTVWLLRNGYARSPPGGRLVPWLTTVLGGCAMPLIPTIMIATTLWP